MRTPSLFATLVPALVLGCSSASTPRGNVTDSGGGGAVSQGGAASGGSGVFGGMPSTAGTSSGGSGTAPRGGATGGGSGGAASHGEAGDGGDSNGGVSDGGVSDGGSAGGEPAPWPCPRGAPCVILPLGDSITYGYGSTTGGGYRVPLMAHALADRHSITFVGSVSSGPDSVSGQAFPKGNEGHSGYSIDDSNSTKGIAPLVDHALAAYRPNIVLLMIGTNDMHYTLDLPNAPTRLGKLLDQITTDAPDALVVVAQIVPANGAQNAPTQTYNAAIPSVVAARAAQGKHLVLVDMYTALGHWSTALFKDSEHPNDAGYATMADAWYAPLRALLP